MRALRPFGLLALLSASAWAQSNHAYPLQGVLTTSAGVAVDGAVSVQFRLYAAATGGAALWSETQSITVDEGLFSAYLGDVVELEPSLFAGHDGLWLGITVGTDSEMQRVFVGAAPYAGYAEVAGNVPTQIAELTGALPSAALPPGVPEGPSFCPAGSVVQGISAAGALACATDQQGAYTGADFALSGESCATGQVQVGTGMDGLPLCETLFASFGCTVGDVIVGFDAVGDPVCDSALDLIAPSGDLTIAGTIAAAEVQTDTLGATTVTATTASVNTLTVGADALVQGGLEVLGGITAGGAHIGYPDNPRVVFGTSWSAGANTGTNVQWIPLPVRFPSNPVFIGSIDESLNDNGATWQRIEQLHPNRVGLRLDSIADAVHWMAIEPGIHTLDGKTVMANTVTNVASGAAIFFPALFAAPPVILLQADESGNQSGGVRARTIGNVTTGGFEVWVDNTVDALHWVAMDAGEYDVGRYHWNADVWALNNSCTGGNANCLVSLPSGMFAAPPGLLHTVQAVDNNGASYARGRNIGAEDVRLRLDAATEFVHYLAFEED